MQSRELVHSAVQCIRSVGESITGTSNTLTNQVLVYTSTITSTDTLHYVPVLVVVPVQIHSGQVSIKGWLVRPLPVVVLVLILVPLVLLLNSSTSTLYILVLVHSAVSQYQ